MKKIIVTEETEGRYFLDGHGIEEKDFSTLKREDKIHYWNKDFLEECDMFFLSPGWRLTSSAITFLQDRGYEISIDTTLLQKKRRRESLLKKLKKKKQDKENNENYKQEIKQYEKWLGSPEFREKKKGEWCHLDLKWIELKDGKLGEYFRYALTEKNHIFCHRHYNSDWWDNVVSVEIAPQHIIDEAKKIAKEKQQEREKEDEEREEKQKKEKARIAAGLKKMIQRISIDEVEKRMKKGKFKDFCPQELAENGRENVRLTILEAREILERTKPPTEDQNEKTV